MPGNFFSRVMKNLFIGRARELSEHGLFHRLSLVALLEKLDIDARRVAIEHNLTIIKRHRFPEVVVGDGDQVEIVNFVGGG